MNTVDYYQILGVSRTATATEIKKAYRALLIKYHPDKNPDNTLAEEKTKEINAAYDILGNEKKRHNYDIELAMAEKMSGSYTNTSENYNDEYEEDTYNDDDKEEYVYDEEVEENTYHTNYQHQTHSYNTYETLLNTPILAILDSFSHYPFNTATKAIYKHGFFPLLGNSISCLLIITAVLINRTIRLINHDYSFGWKRTSTRWLDDLNSRVAENNLFKYVWWFIILAFMVTIKLFVYTLIILIALIVFVSVIASALKRNQKR